MVITSFDAGGKNNFLKKCHTIDSLIEDVLYADFYLHEYNLKDTHQQQQKQQQQQQQQHRKPCKCLCVLEKEFLNVFTDEGELFVAALPFKVRESVGVPVLFVCLFPGNHWYIIFLSGAPLEAVG